ncbi:hypothetical protein HAX54_030528, partial [Datura stramonium]|nr:hypothetical protein [Datura stramonium]
NLDLEVVEETLGVLEFWKRRGRRICECFWIGMRDRLDIPLKTVPPGTQNDITSELEA